MKIWCTRHAPPPVLSRTHLVAQRQNKPLPVLFSFDAAPQLFRRSSSTPSKRPFCLDLNLQQSRNIQTLWYSLSPHIFYFPSKKQMAVGTKLANEKFTLGWPLGVGIRRCTGTVFLGAFKEAPGDKNKEKKTAKLCPKMLLVQVPGHFSAAFFIFFFSWSPRAPYQQHSSGSPSILLLWPCETWTATFVPRGEET